MILESIEKVLLATGNKGKIAEFEEAFADCSIKWYGLGDFHPQEVEESGKTFLENAFIKAKAGFENSGLPTIADDSGLIVPIMGDYPGVLSARIGGEGLTDRERCQFLMNTMQEQGVEEGTPAYFASTIVVMLSEREAFWTEGKVEGRIMYSLRGENGFGYDPIFYLPEFDQRMAELSIAQKNDISHRGRAIKALHEGRCQPLDCEAMMAKVLDTLSERRL